ncbi:clathrin heavy chain linker domain-containing protein 1 [Tyto alba]|uniref:clathrin heavy chain linker domain-containing protein 1 n=1 Tax=Tyto alba TaxID=56313 RepID=UPI001C67B8D8|nr:clathrin heavy chain linker domain-containing protein 1 [Tyto alba]
MAGFSTQLHFHRSALQREIPEIGVLLLSSALWRQFKNILRPLADAPRSMRSSSGCVGHMVLELGKSFSELLSSGQYDAAAIYSLNSPRGILCNEEALNCLKGRNIPLLKYCNTLINSSAAAGHVPNSTVTLEAFKCALSEKQLNLVTHWVEQQRLTFSKAVGDIIYDYRKVEPIHKSRCLALAQVAYDDYFFLLENGSSTALICCLSQQWIRKPPFSSVGAAILSFISANHKKHGFELLEEMSKKSKHSKILVTNFQAWNFNSTSISAYALEQVILNYTVCTLEDWSKIAFPCADNKHEKLSQKVVSILTSQDGVCENSPLEDEEDARIMEHIFCNACYLLVSFRMLVNYCCCEELVIDAVLIRDTVFAMSIRNSTSRVVQTCQRLASLMTLEVCSTL